MSFPYTLDLAFGSEKATVDSLGRSSFSSSSPSPTPTPTYVWKTESKVAVDGNSYHFEFRIASVADGHTEEEITEHFSTGKFKEDCQGKSAPYTYYYRITGVGDSGTYNSPDLLSSTSLPVTVNVQYKYGMNPADVFGTLEVALIKDSDSSSMSSFVHFSNSTAITEFQISVI